MRHIAIVMMIPVFASLAGCGGGTAVERPTEAIAVGSHGGAVVALPDGAGRVEVAIEALGKGSNRQIVAAYFSGDDLKSPITSPPEMVEAKIEFPGREPAVVPLARDAAKGDAAGPVRFASKPGDFAVDPLIGTLNVTLGGQAHAIPFRVGDR